MSEQMEWLEIHMTGKPQAIVESPTLHERVTKLEQQIEQHFEFVEWTRLLTAENIRWQLHYDIDYGVDKRAGYSVCINGVFYSHFENSAVVAMEKAFKAWGSAQQENGK